MSAEPTVRIHAYEFRSGRYELRDAGSSHGKGVFEVPASLWSALLEADEAQKAATLRNKQATLAVVEYVAQHHPGHEVFDEWAQRGMEGFE